jgi:hypothetical protein
MNAKTLLLNAAIGVLTGAAVLFFLGETPLACCFGACGLMLLASLIGPALAPLFYGFVVRPGSALGFGVVHGLLVAGMTVIVCGIGVLALASDQTVRDALDRDKEWFDEIVNAAESGDMPEDQRKQFRKQTEAWKEALGKAKEDPKSVRYGVLSLLSFAALVFGVLGGLLGGWLGSLIFRDRLRPKPGTEPDDRMRMPEQPKPWWEEE